MTPPAKRPRTETSWEMVQVTIPKPWLRLIQYCKTTVPHGTVTVSISGGCPTDLLKEDKRVRFDRDLMLPDYVLQESVKIPDPS